jgi:MFS family permease
VNDPSSSQIHERFDWKWVSLGVLFSVGGNLLAYLALRPILDDLLHRQERVLRAAALLAGVALAIYFLGGLLVGRMSRHHTVKEPAVAGVIAVAILTGLQLYLGMVNIIGLVLGAPVCFGVSYLGGILGEKWQEAVLGRRSSRGS